MQNEKTAVYHNDGSCTEFNEKTTMSNNTRKQLEFQFDSAIPPKIIICFNCHREKEFDGFLFKLVEVCGDCRTESEVQITGKRFERRRQNR